MTGTFQHPISFLFFSLLCCSGAFSGDSTHGSRRNQRMEYTFRFTKRHQTENKLRPMNTMPEMGVAAPVTTVPVFYSINQQTKTPVDVPALSASMSERDVVTPITTVPMINPTSPMADAPVVNPVSSTPIIPMTPYTTPTIDPVTGIPNTGPSTGTPIRGPTMGITNTTPNMGTPSASSGQSWCIASQTASQTALQVALDYACGYGGADCSAIQSGGSCYNPATVRDHASYAFNSYYQKIPIPTSCDFGGTAMVTNIDPSTPGCQHPSASTSSSILNTTDPSGSSVFGNGSPDSSEATMTLAFTLASILMSLFTASQLLRMSLTQ